MSKKECDPSLLFAMKALECENVSSLKLKTLVEEYCSNHGIRINADRTSRTYSHVVSTAKMFNRIKEYLPEEGCSLSNEDYLLLLNSGTLFFDCVGRLNNLEKQRCAELLKSCLHRWPSFDMGKHQLTNYIKSQTVCYRHEQHDSLTKKHAVPFLWKQGCSFVSTEVRFSDKRKIDALGWHIETNTVYGIDVKTTVRDFREKRDRQLAEYLQFCDQLYILTASVRVAEAVYEWNKQNGGTIGLLFCDSTTLETTVLLETENQRGLDQNKKADAQERVYRKCIAEQMEKSLANYNKTEDPTWLRPWILA